MPIMKKYKSWVFIYGEKKGSAIKGFLKLLLKIIQSQPLAFLEEDIREVLKEETGTDIFLKEEDEPAYKSCKQEVIFQYCC